MMDAPLDDMRSLPNVGEARAKCILSAGISTFDQLVTAVAIPNIPAGVLSDIKMSARAELAKRQAPISPPRFDLALLAGTAPLTPNEELIQVINTAVAIEHRGSKCSVEIWPSTVAEKEFQMLKSHLAPAVFSSLEKAIGIGPTRPTAFDYVLVAVRHVGAIWQVIGVGIVDQTTKKTAGKRTLSAVRLRVLYDTATFTPYLMMTELLKQVPKFQTMPQAIWPFSRDKDNQVQAPDDAQRPPISHHKKPIALTTRAQARNNNPRLYKALAKVSLSSSAVSSLRPTTKKQ